MPYKTPKQAAYFRGCLHNPGKMKGKCPERKVLVEFERADKLRKGKGK